LAELLQLLNRFLSEKGTVVNGNCFRPDGKYENEQYFRIKKKLFAQFSSGWITNRDKIIDVCLTKYKEHELVLEENIASVHAESLIRFVLNQYGEYAKRNSDYHQFRFSAAEEKEWLAYASHARRGMKYLLEYLCFHKENLTSAEGQDLSSKEGVAALSRIFISIEEMCATYLRIDGYRFLMNDVQLKLDEKEWTYFHVPQDLEPRNQLDVREERQEISRRINGKPYAHDIECHSKLLEPKFSDHLGISYAQLIHFLKKYLESQVHEVCVIPKEEVISDLQEKFNISFDQAANVIHGFSMRAINLVDRTLVNPKQEYRAYHRGFFEFQRDKVSMLYFSRTMALENLDTLINNTCYHKLPEEWKTSAIEIRLTALSNMAGKWFEEVLSTNLVSVGIKAISSVSLYRSQGKRIRPPEDVGEIDFIGYSAEHCALFVIEAKNVRFSTEPRLFRDDLSKFIDGKKSYAEKFISKCQWVVENLAVVKDEMKQQSIQILDIKKIYKVMVILAPSPVEDRISQFSCVNLVKFMRIVESGDLAPFHSVDMP